MSLDQLSSVLGWLFGGFLAVAVIEFLAVIGLRAINAATPAINLPARLILAVVLVVVCLGCITGTVIFVHSRISHTLAPPASVRFLKRHGL